MPCRARHAAAALATLVVAVLAVVSGCSAAREEALLSGGALWGMGRSENSEAESITVHEGTVLIVRYTGGQWALDALDAASGKRRWTHRIWSFRAPGFDDGRAETGPVIVGAGERSLALVKDFSECDALGNCARSWLRFGVTAIRIADGSVAWSSMPEDPPAGASAQQPWRLVDARLVGATESVAVASVLGSTADPNQAATGATTTTDSSSQRPSPGLVAFDSATGRRLWTKPQLRGAHVAGQRSSPTRSAAWTSAGSPCSPARSWPWMPAPAPSAGGRPAPS